MTTEQIKMLRTHELKTDPAVFAALHAGVKTHEIRLNDRGFAIGDRLVLRETEHSSEHMQLGSPLIYTGRVTERTVSHIQSGYGLKDGWCILSFAATDLAAREFVYQKLNPNLERTVWIEIGEDEFNEMPDYGLFSRFEKRKLCIVVTQDEKSEQVTPDSPSAVDADGISAALDWQARAESLETCAFELAANLSALPTTKEMPGLVRRDRVMELITQWRIQCNAATPVETVRPNAVIEGYQLVPADKLTVADCHRFGLDIKAVRENRQPTMGADSLSALGHELSGAIADTEQGGGFDSVCLDTVKRVRDALLARPTAGSASGQS